MNHKVKLALLYGLVQRLEGLHTTLVVKPRTKVTLLLFLCTFPVYLVAAALLLAHLAQIAKHGKRGWVAGSRWLRGEGVLGAGASSGGAAVVVFGGCLQVGGAGLMERDMETVRQ